ncbi:MAG: V-type ATP synthase subunit F [Clostridiales bacterium]|nr:V-type ATP synthase subunit F [Clostridiales bacterium]
MHRAAVIGDRDSVYGFAAVGLDTFAVADPSQAARQLRGLAEAGYAAIYVVEALWPHVAAEAARYRERPLPAILPIPGASGNTGIGMAQIVHYVEQAVGSDILSDRPGRQE